MFWQVSCLALAALRSDRFSQTQVSRTVPVLPTILINTNLNGLEAVHTHHTQKDSSSEPVSASAFREALDLRPARSGAPEFPLHPCDVTVTSPDRGSALVRPSRAAPGRDLNTRTPIDKLTGISARRPCVHVAPTFIAWCEGNGVEGGDCSPQRSVAAAVTRNALRPHCRTSPITGMRLPQSDPAGRQGSQSHPALTS